MTRRRYVILLAVAIMVAGASLTGCGSSGSSTASSSSPTAAKADLTIAAKFPAAAGAVKSLIPAGTAAIEVYAIPLPRDYQNVPTLIATLTPAAPSKTIKMGAGQYEISALAYDSTDTATRRVLGGTSTAGEILANVPNTVNLTFLNGIWTIVNAAGAASPIVFSDNTTQLESFVVSGQQGMAAKSAFDPTKPISGGGGPVRLRFNNNTSARTYGWMASQFVGATNTNALGSESYNMTQKCGWSDYYGLPCEERAGDRIVMIAGRDDMSGGDLSGHYNEGNMLYGDAYQLLPNKGNTSFLLNGSAFDLMAALPATSISGGNTITGGIVEWNPTTARVSTIGTPSTAKVARAGVVKAQSTNTTYANLTVKDYEEMVCSSTNPSNRGTWSFANNTSMGKKTFGSRVCYTNWPNLSSQWDPIAMTYQVNAGDYSYGLVPADANNLGDYCHQWDYMNNTCLKQLPGAGDIYQPWNFRAVKTDTKTTINYGSFKYNFWQVSTQTGTVYVYPFTAKGN